MNWAEVIEAVKDYRRGAQTRVDSLDPTSPYETLSSEFFEGKVCAYNDIVSWLESKRREENK